MTLPTGIMAHSTLAAHAASIAAATAATGVDLPVPCSAVLALHGPGSACLHPKPSAPGRTGRSRGAHLEDDGPVGVPSQPSSAAAVSHRTGATVSRTSRGVQDTGSLRIGERRANPLLVGGGMAPPPVLRPMSSTPPSSRPVSRSATSSASATPPASRSAITAPTIGGGSWTSAVMSVDERLQPVRPEEEMASLAATAYNGCGSVGGNSPGISIGSQSPPPHAGVTAAQRRRARLFSVPVRRQATSASPMQPGSAGGVVSGAGGLSGSHSGNGQGQITVHGGYHSSNGGYPSGVVVTADASGAARSPPPPQRVARAQPPPPMAAVLARSGGGSQDRRSGGRKPSAGQEGKERRSGNHRSHSVHDFEEAAAQEHNESVMQMLASFALEEFKRRPSDDLAEFDTFRERIRTLEKEKASLQRQHQATKMSLAQGELVVQTLRFQVDSLQREMSQQRDELEAVRKTGEGQCIVCMEDAATHVVVPCGHFAFCQRCSGLASSTCPLCRQAAERVIRVFRP